MDSRWEVDIVKALRNLGGEVARIKKYIRKLVYYAHLFQKLGKPLLGGGYKIYLLIRQGIRMDKIYFMQ
jgi:hypothetical protein